MAIKKQLKDKDGNTIYPDVGLNLDDAVYSDDPESVGDDYIDPSSYSTTEYKTGGTWIDGKPIYKKTVSIGYLPSAAGFKNVAHGITNVDKFIKIEGFYTNGTNTFESNTTAPGSNNNRAVRTYVDLTNVNVEVGQDRSDFSGYITLYYTKTTD